MVSITKHIHNHKLKNEDDTFRTGSFKAELESMKQKPSKNTV